MGISLPHKLPLLLVEEISEGKKFMKELWLSVMHFREQASLRQNQEWTWSSIPWVAWPVMTLMAVFGSLIYGYSVVRTAALPMGWEGGVLVALPAGIGWCCLGFALVVVTRKNPFFLAHVCLVSMFWGEVWLLLGALLNLWLKTQSGIFADTVLVLNGGWILFSNLLMFSVWSMQLMKTGVSFGKLLTLWMLVLNGVGVLSFVAIKTAWGL